MSRTQRCAVLVLGLALSTAAAAAAHVRLHVPQTGTELWWANPTDIGFVISSIGSDDVGDDSEEVAIRNALEEWNGVDGSSARFVEDASPAEQARTDWSSASIHLALFDEDNSSSFFPPGSGIVAITPVWFSVASGQITDADVLFNGSQFEFTTAGESGRYDVQDVATHELGHFLGLDHSGWAGASMYPYVSTAVIAHRSVSADDAHGVREVYPAGSFATLEGTVLRLADSSAVAGAHVVACDADGRTAGATLSEDDGDFRIVGLDGGTYTVYASPLDARVSSANLTAGHTVRTDFEPAIYGAPAVVTSGQTVSLGNLLVDADVALNLGDAGEPLPLRAEPGTSAYVVRGTGLVAGSTLEASDPTLTVTPLSWFGTQVAFNLTVPPAAAPGHVDLRVTDPLGRLAILPAAIEVTPTDPTVGGVMPSSGSSVGGELVTITGSDFRAGSRVVLGDRVYVDGEPGGATVVDPSTITLTTAATALGTHDVVVIDPTGVEGRLASAFQVADLPTIATVFPNTGAAAGGTFVVVRGSNFAAGVELRIDGVLQSQVTLDSPTRLTVTTDAGVAGAQVLEVRNADGGLAQAAYVYVPQGDPSLTQLVPATGETAGGESITLTGSNFTASTTVRFDVDPDTGAGGVPATAVTLVDPSTLSVETPAFGSGAGTVSVMVTEPMTGQASVLPAAFTFSASGGGGGGGGGAAPLRATSPPGPIEAVAGLWWLAVLLVFLAARSRSRSRATQAPRALPLRAPDPTGARGVRRA